MSRARRFGVLLVASLAIVGSARNSAAAKPVERQADKPQKNPPAPLLTAEVSGRVALSKLVAVKKIPVLRDADKCGREKVDETWAFARDLGLRHVIVWLEGVPSPSPVPPKNTITVQQITCAAVPRVSAAVLGATLELRNLDAVQHQAHAFFAPLANGPQDPQSWFALGLPTKGVGVRRKLERTGVVHIANEAAHPYLQAWVGVFDHPWFTVTDELGRFAFSGVPYGRYDLKSWHEAGGIKSRAIQVDSAGLIDVNVMYDPTTN